MGKEIGFIFCLKPFTGSDVNRTGKISNHFILDLMGLADLIS
jgi:hypothetical protein